MTRDVVREGIGRSLDRMALDRVDLMQFHWWMFQHPAYLDALEEMATLRDEGRIGHIGVTNFDADHLRLIVRHGLPIVSNQVSFSLLDRRAAGALSAFCQESGVRLLAYGTLGGGFLSDRWVGKPEPTDIPDWSKSKYKRFIDVIGGWPALQALLATLAQDRRAPRRLGVECGDPAGSSSSPRWRPSSSARASASASIARTT